MKLLKIAISTALATGITAGAVSAENLKATFGAKTKASAPAAYKAQTARGQAAGDIVRTWAGYVRSVYGTAPTAWARDMQSTFATADVRNLQRAAKMTTFEGMMSALMGQRTSDEKIIDQFARAEGALAEVLRLGSPTEDLVYTAVAPCRVLDTRLAGGALAAGETRNFSSSAPNFTNQGGAASDCTIPANASAVVMNVVTVAPASVGYLTVFPFGTPQPLASSLNFIVGRDTSNELIVKQAMGQVFDFSVFTASQAHVIADVAGYFMAPFATAVECVTVDGPQANNLPISPVTLLPAAMCPTGFEVTGGGVRGTGEISVHGSYPVAVGSGWTAEAHSGSGDVDANAVARCCRVPGR